MSAGIGCDESKHPERAVGILVRIDFRSIII
jgi:hypothetical protein